MEKYIKGQQKKLRFSNNIKLLSIKYRLISAIFGSPVLYNKNFENLIDKIRGLSTTIH